MEKEFETYSKVLKELIALLGNEYRRKCISDLWLKVLGSDHHFDFFEGGLVTTRLCLTYARPGTPENPISDTSVFLVIIFAIQVCRKTGVSHGLNCSRAHSSQRGIDHCLYPGWW